MNYSDALKYAQGQDSLIAKFVFSDQLAVYRGGNKKPALGRVGRTLGDHLRGLTVPRDLNPFVA
ncbi:hypothetical protein D3C86_2176400 [compost metagenome]